MFGDYISTSMVSGGNAYPVLALARAPTGSTFNQAMFVPAGGLAVTGGSNTAAANAGILAPSGSTTWRPFHRPLYFGPIDQYRFMAYIFGAHALYAILEL